MNDKHSVCAVCGENVHHEAFLSAWVHSDGADHGHNVITIAIGSVWTRDAADPGASVEVADTSHGGVVFSTVGGGFLRSMDRASFLAAFAPAPPVPPMTLARFSFDDTFLGEDAIVGYNDGVRWNGWSVPYVTRAEAERFAEVMRGGPSEQTVVVTDDAITVGTDPDERWENVVREVATVDGVLRLYCLGDLCWNREPDAADATVRLALLARVAERGAEVVRLSDLAMRCDFPDPAHDALHEARRVAVYALVDDLSDADSDAWWAALSEDERKQGEADYGGGGDEEPWRSYQRNALAWSLHYLCWVAADAGGVS